MSTVYLAITLGPIKKTMGMARKTREFWAASMLFSLLAKALCDQLKKAGTKKEEFLVPHPSVFDHEIKDVGLYLDRIICKVPGKEFIDQFEETIVKPALGELCKEVNLVADSNFSVADLQSYFKIHALCLLAEDAKPLQEISKHLNTLELFSKESSISGVSGKIKQFLENVNTEYDDSNHPLQSTFLDRYLKLPDFNGNNRIPSIVEVTTIQIQRNEAACKKYKDILNKYIWKKSPEENKLFPELKKEFNEDIRNYHKYFCILQADGDHLGTTLLESNSKSIYEISSDLITWGKTALQMLKNYGALPIYIGGDDLLCFAPVHNGQESILDLAFKLNSTYNQMSNLLSKELTLRVGIKISYYKSPMFEAYEESLKLLNKASESRNSCCINLEKHSGQPHHFCFSFKEEYSHYIKPLFDSMTGDKKDKNFLTSIIYKIAENEELFSIISHDYNRVWAFCQNQFEETKEKSGQPVYPEKYAFLVGVAKYLVYLFQQNKTNKDEGSKMYVATFQLYSILKSIRFIKGLDDDKDE